MRNSILLSIIACALCQPAASVNRANRHAEASLPHQQQEQRSETPPSTYRRTLLIEEFTSQFCGSCPGGAEKIHELTAQSSDRVALLVHHAGYQDDAFTLTESHTTKTALGVTFAPSCAVNRETHPDAGKLVYDPRTTLTQQYIDSLLETPAEASIDVTNTYDADTHQIIMSITGMINTSSANEGNHFVTALITQGGMKAMQSGAGNSYQHNDFPFYYLTATEGDAVQVDENGYFEMTITRTIPEKSCNNEAVKFMPAKAKIVAFIAGEWTETMDRCGVLNAVSKKMSLSPASIDATTSDTIAVRPENGKISVYGNYQTFSVYDMSGKRIRNANLLPGIYLVQIQCEAGIRTVKTIVK